MVAGAVEMRGLLLCKEMVLDSTSGCVPLATPVLARTSLGCASGVPDASPGAEKGAERTRTMPT